jgi:hypothetical protein
VWKPFLFGEVRVPKPHLCIYAHRSISYGKYLDWRATCKRSRIRVLHCQTETTKGDIWFVRLPVRCCLTRSPSKTTTYILHRHTYLYVWVHANIHSNKHIFRHAYIYTYVHTHTHNTHTYIHTYTHTFQWINKFVTKAVGCATSHPYTNIHNMYSVKHYNHFTQQYYRSSLRIKNSSTEWKERVRVCRFSLKAAWILALSFWRIVTLSGKLLKIFRLE